MKTLIIADTQGSAIRDAYRELVPGVDFRGVQPKGQPAECHPHGSQCGWLAAKALAAAADPWRVLFVRIMDGEGRLLKGWDKYLLDMIALHEPAIVSRSWGAWDGDTTLGRMIAQAATQDFAMQYNALRREIGFLDFAAAGNDDSNDRDDDIAYPQPLVEGCHIIGSHRRCGVADEWSGDGVGMECCMWASGIQAPDQSARFSKVYGTSFAAPKAAGVCGAYGLDDAGWTDLCRSFADVPEGDWERPHPKWGWGSMERFWQELALRQFMGQGRN